MRKNATKIAALALTLALTVTSVNIPTNASAATVKLNKKKATLYVSGAKSKKTTTLKVTGTKKKVTFTSNKKSVATVNKKGKVTAKKAGKATITAKVGKKSYKCTVTVKKKYTPVTSVSVSPKTVSLKVGKTKTIKATVKPSKPTEKGVTYKSSKTSVATVSSKGKITAKKAGKATITVTAKGASKSGSNKKATVAVTVTKDDTKPTDAPSTAPSDAPTDAPSTAPTDAPSTAPTTLGKITELKATKAAQLTATFDSAVPDGVTFEVTKGSAKVEGKFTTDGVTVVFDATANLTAGKYTLTATLGDVKETAEAEVKDSHVAEIKITSKEALTAEGNPVTASGSAITETEKLAYIYYDVLNQYGESIRTSTTINWTTSIGNDTKKVDKSLGRITISNGTTSFTYGSLIYITGVHVDTGTTFSTSVPVGMAQAVDSIQFSGFLNKNDKTKKLENLPNDFAKDTFYLLYKTFDQNGNMLDPNEIAADSLTFICDNPLLMSISTDNTAVFTVGSEEYAAVAVQPGQYVDKGGEVNITAISTRTGTKTTQNYTIGSAGVLQSLVLTAPASTVADGDQDVKIPYTAKDVEGNVVTNYETIVRSTNSLSLSASGDTELKVKEENDGTAGIYWSDSKTAGDYTESSASDNISRNISLTTVVVGGESNNMMLEVSDMRRPVAIKSVKLNEDNNDAIAVGNNAVIKFKDGKNDNTIVFLDQYNAELDGDIAAEFFKHTSTNTFDKGYYYGIKVDVVGENNMSLTDKVYCGENISVAATLAGEKMAENTVRYSIVRAKDKTAAFNGWDDVSSVRTVLYNIIPVNLLKNSAVIKSFAKQELTTSNSSASNGSTLTETAEVTAASSGAISFVEDKVNANLGITVTGTYQGKTVTLPTDAYTTASSSAITVNSGKIESVTGLTWGDLYNFTAYGNPRKDAERDLVLAIADRTIKRSITFSDEESKIAEIKFVYNTNASAESATVTPNMMAVKAPRLVVHDWNTWDNLAVMVFDQYGKVLGIDSQDKDTWHGYNSEDGAIVVEFAVSEIKENMDALAHKASSFTVNADGSNKMSIDGAEINDTFKLTATVAGTKVSDSIKVTVGADASAYIDQTGSGTKGTPGTKDLGLREQLGYDR